MVQASSPQATRRTGWAEVLRISWPLIIANGFWNLQLTIDRIFLGNYSTDSLGAAVAVMGVFWTPMALLQQTAAYSMTFVAQYLGAKRPHDIGPVVWQSIYLSIIGGLLFLLFIPLSADIFYHMGHSEQMQTLESSYFAALCFSALPTAIVAATSGFFTGLGRSRVIMWINGVGLVANVFFDYLFIFGKLGFPAMGIAGAGYATALANLFAASFSLFLIFHRHHESDFLMRSRWRPNFNLMKRFLRYGLPSGLQWSLEGMAFTVFLIILGQMPNGDAALSASGIAVTIMMLAVLPALGVGQGVSVLVGQHLGNNCPEKAEKTTWSGLQIAALYILFMGLSFVLFPEFYLSWFHNADQEKLWAEVSVIVTYLLMFVAFFILFDSMNLIFSFSLKGAGDTKFVTLVALTLPWPLMILPTWLFRHDSAAVYWAWAACTLFICTQAIVFWRRFVGGMWKSMRVISD
ncbi:MAG: MATE family efflux transporter [Oligoflexus sp.]